MSLAGWPQHQKKDVEPEINPNSRCTGDSMTNEENQRPAVSLSSASKLGFGVLVILALTVGGIWRHSHGKFRHSASTTTAKSTSAQSVVTPSVPKPSPYHYTQPPEVVPNLVTTPVVRAKVMPVVPRLVVPKPNAPITTLAPAHANPATAASSGLQFVANRKGARHGCKEGLLTLAPSRLVFSCQTDQSKSLTLDLSQVKGIDDDGIEALSSEKYHFKISGKSKEQVHQLFADWKAKTTMASATDPNGR